MKLKLALSAAMIVAGGTSTLSANETTQLDTIQVVTTASGFEQNISDASATMSVITAEELEKKSYTSVADALKNVPGLNVVSNGSDKSISIRGMGKDYTLFLIDGKPSQSGEAYAIRGGIPGALVNYMPPLEAIERIEIIRGPASALYGSDAIGGVINIITKKHSDKVMGSIKAEYIKADKSNKVNNSTQNTSAYVNIPLIERSLSFQLDTTITDIKESEHSVSGADEDFDRKNLRTKLIYTPNDNNTIKALYSYTIQERYGRVGKSVPLLNSMGQKNSDVHTKIERNSYGLEHQAKYDEFSINSYINKEKDTSLSQKTQYETFLANTQVTYFSDNNSLTLGANYKKEKLLDDSSNAVKPKNEKLTSMDRYQWSLFAEDTWQTTDKLALTLSGRYDDNEKFGSQFSPKAYAIYNLTDKLNLKAGITSGYKAPNLRVSSDNFATASMGGDMIGNSKLKAEKSINYEAGLAYDNPQLGLSASLMLFQIDFKNKILRSGTLAGSKDKESDFYKKDYPNFPFSKVGYTKYYNVDEAQSKGLELTTEYAILDNLKYRHSYTYNKTKQKTGKDKGKPFSDTPKHSLNIGLDWDVNSKLLLWTQLNYSGKTSGNVPQGGGDLGLEKRAYTLVDLGAVYKYSEKIAFSGGIYNLTNRTNKVLGDVNKSNERDLDGRRFSLAMNVKF